jgi:hypothetical protein
VSQGVNGVMCDSQGVEWEYEVVGVGISNESASSETGAQEEFLFIVCWPRRPSETIGFRHIRAALDADLDSRDIQRKLLG